MVVEVAYEERYWYPEDGGALWIAGYHLLAPGSGRYLARDAPELGARGLLVLNVAGARDHHADALLTDEAAPGRPLELRRDPGNVHDPNAIAVHVPGGDRLGWVPREAAAELAPQLDAGRPWSALALRERRPSPREARSGLVMLLAASTEVELSEQPGGRQ